MERGLALQLSTYLTLTLAAVCLGFADMFFLRWMPGFLTAIGLVFYLAWRNEGRWHLSESAANSLGLVIAFGTLAWLVFQAPRTEEELAATGVPWPAGMLPHVGPLLMILTAVKLFRPKHIPDFWSLQILSVMMVTLASVLAGEFDHGIWIILYLICQVWCLASFYETRPQWIHLSAEERLRTPLFIEMDPANSGPSRWQGLLRAAAASMAIGGFGAALFLGIPRYGSSQWIPHKLAALSAARHSGGLDGGMDLNRTDKVELSYEIAFEVNALGPDGESRDLPATMYWRTDTFDVYMNGRWYRAIHIAEQSNEGIRLQTPGDAIELRIIPPGDMDAPRNPHVRPAKVPADLLYLSIHVLPSLAGSLVCAEPVEVQLGKLPDEAPLRGIGIAPCIGDRPARTAIFEYLDGADLVIAHSRRMPYHYGQTIDPAQDPFKQAAGRIQAEYRDTTLTQGPTEDLGEWARQLLQRVAGLTAAERTLDDNNRVPMGHHARVAQAISRHFAHSGEYLYSLNRRRVDLQVDPNVDFLANVKEGHCERYASGLALTLRSLGIPSRIVYGFHGYERGDDGTPCVRFTRAHSWVQSLVPRGQGKDFDWLLLDPTPSEEAPLNAWQKIAEWWGDVFHSLRSGFHNGVLEYAAGMHLSVLLDWWESISTGSAAYGLAALAALGAIGLAWRWGRVPLAKWRETRNAARWQRLHAPWLTQALDAIQSATGEAPKPSDTLLEFAHRIRSGRFAALAAPFETIAGFANRVRFGDTAVMSPADQATIAAAIGSLRRVGAPS